MKRSIWGLTIVIFLVAALVAGCSSQKGPAETAIKAVEDAFNASKAEAVKYAPDQVKSIEDALGGLKEKFAKGDYKAVIADATTLVDQAKSLGDVAKAKKEELTKSWGDLSEGLPKMVEAIQGRVNVLSAAKKLPANLTPESFEEVKTGLTAAKEEWAKAQESIKAGNLAEAVAMAAPLKEKAMKFMEVLGISLPEKKDAPAAT